MGKRDVLTRSQQDLLREEGESRTAYEWARDHRMHGATAEQIRHWCKRHRVALKPARSGRPGEPDVSVMKAWLRRGLG